MSLYDGISVETAPIPEIVDNVKKKDDGIFRLEYKKFVVIYNLYRAYNIVIYSVEEYHSNMLPVSYRKSIVRIPINGLTTAKKQVIFL